MPSGFLIPDLFAGSLDPGCRRIVGLGSQVLRDTLALGIVSVAVDEQIPGACLDLDASRGEKRHRFLRKCELLGLRVGRSKGNIGGLGPQAEGRDQVPAALYRAAARSPATRAAMSPGP